VSSLVEEARAACPGVDWTPVQPTTLVALESDGFPRLELRTLLDQHGDAPLLVVNDLARVIHCGLPQLLHELRGLAPALQVLVATGTHAGDAAAEAARLGCPVLLHACDDAAAHVDVGGFAVDRRLLQASCVIGVGSVEPHYFAGWTGAHKTLSVGLWDRATVQANHAHACSLDARPLDASDANPVAQGIRAGVRALVEQGPPALAVNHVLDPQGVPLAVGWGDPDAALEQVTPLARARCAHEQADAVDVVVARVEGPLSRSLYQADKGVKNHEAVVKDGGLLVLVAELTDGLGPDRFVRLLEQAPTVEAAREVIARDGYTLGDHKALRWRALEARGVRVVVASEGLDSAAVSAAGLRVVPSVAAALAGETFAPGATGLAVADAGFVASQSTPATDP